MESEGFSLFELEPEEFSMKKTEKFTRMWGLKFGGAVTELIFHHGIVYIASADHHVYAVNGESGEEVWRFRTNGVICDSLPLIHKNNIYFGSYDQNFYCLTLEGKLAWKFRTGGEIGSSPGRWKDWIYFGSRDGYVYCLNRESGKEIWRFRTGDEIASAATIYNNTVFIGSYDGYFYCINAKTGKEIWRFKTGDHVWSDNPFTVHNGIVYFASFDNYLYALDAENGKEVWRFKTGKYGNTISAVIYKNNIYQPSRDGIIYCLTLEGKEVWRFETGDGPAGPPLGNGDVIYLSCDSGYMAAVERKTGKEIWRFRTGGYAWWMALNNDTLYLASWDCRFYALDTKTGKEKWRFATSVQHQPPLDPPFEIFEMIVKKDITTEDEDVQKYEVNFGESLKDEYEGGNEYQVKVEYQQKMKY